MATVVSPWAASAVGSIAAAPTTRYAARRKEIVEVTVRWSPWGGMCRRHAPSVGPHNGLFARRLQDVDRRPTAVKGNRGEIAAEGGRSVDMDAARRLCGVAGDESEEVLPNSDRTDDLDKALRCYTCIARRPTMLALRLSPEIEKRLDRLAKKTGRTKSFYAREAILRHLEDLEDFHLAQRRLA